MVIIMENIVLLTVDHGWQCLAAKMLPKLDFDRELKRETVILWLGYIENIPHTTKLGII